jgi:hypothetical protein
VVVRGWWALALVVGGLGWAVEARAESLVAGDLLDFADRAAFAGAEDELSLDRFEASREAALLNLPFTPRNPLSLIFGAAEPEADAAGELRVGVTQSRTRLERLASLRLGGDGGPEAGEAPRTLEIGGALHWSDWVIGSGYARATLFGGDAEMLSATLGYGRVQARLAYGQAETGASDGLDVLMLSTDLAAWSWLTLESDLAFGAREDRADEGLAVGRLGIRLNF